MKRKHERQTVINPGEIPQDAFDNSSNADGNIINNSNAVGVGVGVGVVAAGGGGGGRGDAGASGGGGVSSFRSKEASNQENGVEGAGVAACIRALMHDMVESIAGGGSHVGVGGGQSSGDGPSGVRGGGHDGGAALGGGGDGGGGGRGGGGADGGSGRGRRGVGVGGKAILTGGMPMGNLGSHAVGEVPPGPSENGGRGREVGFGLPPRASEPVRLRRRIILWTERARQ